MIIVTLVMDGHTKTIEIEKGNLDIVIERRLDDTYYDGQTIIVEQPK